MRSNIKKYVQPNTMKFKHENLFMQKRTTTTAIKVYHEDKFCTLSNQTQILVDLAKFFILHTASVNSFKYPY